MFLCGTRCFRFTIPAGQQPYIYTNSIEIATHFVPEEDAKFDYIDFGPGLYMRFCPPTPSGRVIKAG